MTVFKQVFDVPSLEFYKLDNIREALKKLDNPQLGRPCILVAGTNAKGSVVSYLSELFQLTGKKISSYYSPHIESECERIQINSELIPEGELERLRVAHREVLKPLTYFEQMTCLAFEYFREQKVDLQILEVGMGGRLDATNLSEPYFSAVTSIGLDHEEVLGRGERAIAREKSGIMRKGRAVWLADSLSELAQESCREVAQEVGAEIRSPSSSDLPENIVQQIHCELKDQTDFQIENAKLAVAIFLEACREWGWKQTALPENIFRKAKLKGRCQILSRSPIVVVDGAHNVEAIRALDKFLELNFPDQKFSGVFGVMNEKDPIPLLRILKPRLKALFLVDYYPPRQIPKHRLGQMIDESEIEIEPVVVETDLEWQVQRLRDSSESILVFGSFYLAGHMIRHFRELKK